MATEKVAGRVVSERQPKAERVSAALAQLREVHDTLVELGAELSREGSVHLAGDLGWCINPLNQVLHTLRNRFESGCFRTS